MPKSAPHPARARPGRAGAIGLAIVLTGIAGWVDAIGYLQLGRLFVSFMSGNSTLLSLHLAQGDGLAAAVAAVVIALFVVGSFVATFLAAVAGPRRVPAVLLLEAGLLGMALLLPAHAGRLSPAIVPLVLAMGAQTVALPAIGGRRIGLTYVTGTLTSLGGRLADAALGRAGPFAWVPYAGLWAGLGTGALLGTLAYDGFGTTALAVPAALVLGLAVMGALFRWSFGR